MITRHLKISGRVQGVYFRESTRLRARELKVTGWVRNRADGTVEAMVQGEPEAVDQMIEWARRGPDSAKVSNVEIKVGEEADPCESFEIRPSA
jgi:acylphosphatase